MKKKAQIFPKDNKMIIRILTKLMITPKNDQMTILGSDRTHLQESKHLHGSAKIMVNIKIYIIINPRVLPSKVL